MRVFYFLLKLTGVFLWIGRPLDRVTCRELYAEYGLDANTQAFTGHAMALHRDDDYLEQVYLYIILMVGWQ